jgi:hypothetical protein
MNENKEEKEEDIEDQDIESPEEPKLTNEEKSMLIKEGIKQLMKMDDVDRDLYITDISKRTKVRSSTIRKQLQKKIQRSEELKKKNDDQNNGEPEPEGPITIKEENGIWGINYSGFKIIQKEMVPDDTFYPINSKIIGRSKGLGRFLYLGQTTSGFEILTSSAVNTRLSDAGVTGQHVTAIKNYLVTTQHINVLPVVKGYGFDQFTLNKIYLPPKYIAIGALGFGTIMVEDFYVPKDAQEAEKAIFAYKSVLVAAQHGIGEANALLISALCIGSMWADYIILHVGVFPLLILLGKRDKGKSHATKYLGNIPHLPESSLVENPETLQSPAVFAQVSSAGYFPLIIEEARCDQRVFKEILSILLMRATGETTRKRLNQDGTKRDNVPFTRSSIVLANHQISELTDPETISRTIHLDIDIVKSNADEWAKATQEFRDTRASLLSWCIFNIDKIPNLVQMFETAKIITDKIARRIGTDINDRNHRKTISIFMGLEFIKAIFNIPVSDQLNDEIYQLCIEGSKKTIQPNAALILSALHIMNERYESWEQCVNAIETIEAQPNTYKDENGDEVERGPSSKDQMNIASLLRQKADLESKGICTIDKNNLGVSCFVVPGDLIPKIRGEMHDTGFTFKDIRDLKAIFNELKVEIFTSNKRVPGFDKTKYCAFVPIEL